METEKHPINVLAQLDKYIKWKGDTIAYVEREAKISKGSLNSQIKNGKSIGVDKLQDILTYVYPNLNPVWLFTNTGEMEYNTTNTLSDPQEEYTQKPTLPKTKAAYGSVTTWVLSYMGLDTMTSEFRKRLEKLGKSIEEESRD